MSDQESQNRNLMGLGMQIVAQVAVGIVIGLWLDRRFGKTNSMYTIICASFMIVLSLYQFIRQGFKN